MCSVLAYENQVVPAGKLPTLSARAPITFARSTADCPPVTNFDVRIEGEASGAPVLYDWAAQRCTGANHLVVDYTETSSDAGRGRLPPQARRRRRHLACGDAGRAEGGAGYPPFAYAPIDLTGVAVVYNIHDPEQPADHGPHALAAPPRPPHLRLRRVDVLPGSRVQAAEPEARVAVQRRVAAADPGRGQRRHLDHDEVDLPPTSQGGGLPAGQGRRSRPGQLRVQERQVSDVDLREPRPSTMRTFPARVSTRSRPTCSTARARSTPRPSTPRPWASSGVVDLATASRFDLPTAKLVNAAGKAVAPTTDEPDRRLPRDAPGTRRDARRERRVEGSRGVSARQDRLRDGAEADRRRAQDAHPRPADGGARPRVRARCPTAMSRCRRRSSRRPSTSRRRLRSRAPPTIATTTTTAPVRDDDHDDRVRAGVPERIGIVLRGHVLFGLERVAGRRSPRGDHSGRDRHLATGDSARRRVCSSPRSRARPRRTPTADDRAAARRRHRECGRHARGTGALRERAPRSARRRRLRRAWPRLVRSRRVVTRILHPSKLRGAPSATA